MTIGFFPKLGVTGAAVGTTIGRGAAFCMRRGTFSERADASRFTRNCGCFDSDILWNLVKISAPAVLQFTIATASWSALVRVVAGFGSEAIAGYVIGLRVIMFALLPAVGLSNAAATLVGQNLGAGKPERAEKAVWNAAFLNAAVLGSVGLIFLFFCTTRSSDFSRKSRKFWLTARTVCTSSLTALCFTLSEWFWNRRSTVRAIPGHRRF